MGDAMKRRASKPLGLLVLALVALACTLALFALSEDESVPSQGPFGTGERPRPLGVPSEATQ